MFEIRIGLGLRLQLRIVFGPELMFWIQLVLEIDWKKLSHHSVHDFDFDFV